MDWLLDVRRDAAREAAVRAVEDHLRRHASSESVVAAAVDVVEREVGKASADHDGPLLLHLDWTCVHAQLSIVPLPSEAAVLPDSGLHPVAAPERDTLLATASDPRPVTLSVPREVLLNFDPDPVSLVDLDPVETGPAAATIALAAAAESHPVASPDQVAAAAGALLADAAYVHDSVKTAKDALDLFTRLHDALGGASETVHLGEDRIEISIHRSPFGKAIAQIPTLSRITEAMAGRFAARVNGRATVVHDEHISLGDPADRLQIFLGDVPEDVAGSTYEWPPAGTHQQADPSPRLEMTVSLPRQSHSVPVIRRLAAQILRAFGVAADSIHDVELAISEACANVIQHALDSEGYEVSIELAADRCAITVLDRGEGFDASGVRDQADIDAESGRGLTLMRALVDNLNFVSEPKIGAVVHMVKQLDYDNGHPFRRAGTE